MEKEKLYSALRGIYSGAALRSTTFYTVSEGQDARRSDHIAGPNRSNTWEEPQLNLLGRYAVYRWTWATGTGFLCHPGLMGDRLLLQPGRKTQACQYSLTPS